MNPTSRRPSGIVRPIVGAVVAACCCFLAADAARGASVSDFIDFTLRSGATTLLPGRLYVPPEATSDPSVPRPMIVFLHGAGESGTNNLAQINGNLDNLLAEAKRRGAFLYAPQTNGGWGSSVITGRVMTMVDQALAGHNIDVDRLYATGLSMGGGGTWNLLNRYGTRFAAGIPICGIGPASDFVPARLIDQAIAVFHARNDTVVSHVTSRNVINSILSAAHESLPTYPSARDPNVFSFSATGLDLQYMELATGGHGIWPAVYSAPPVYDWLFAHTLAVPEPSALIRVGVAGLSLVAFLRPRRRRRLPC